MGSRGLVPTVDRHKNSGLQHLDAPPRIPDGLSPAGLALWDTAWRECGWLAEQDAPMIEALARLEDEMSTFRGALADHGPLIDEPIVSPRGDVVGSRLVANPAEKMLRQAEKSALAMRRALGLTPVDRARLGLVVQALRRGESSGNDKARAFIDAQSTSKE